MLAFLPSLGWQEMMLILVIGLLLYGRNLPEAGRNMGRFVAQLKRGFQDFRDQMDRDADLRELKKTVQDAAKDLKGVTDIPRALTDPTRALKNIAHEALTSPLPEPEPPPDPKDAVGAKQDPPLP